LDNGYIELHISGSHVLAVSSLPPIHKDPFDRILVAQSRTEGVSLLTADKTLARYGGNVICV
jgi:PIN domain nuclease of toxin-antitoxin system